MTSVMALTVLVTGAQAQSPTARRPGSNAPAEATAFIDVAVVPMDTERVLANQTVVVRGARIVALGPAAKVPVPAGAVRIDGRGKFLIPGLADMHAHLQDIPRADSVEVERRLLRWLANGVTTIRNMDWKSVSGAQALRYKARAAAGELLSPRIYTAGPFMRNGAPEPTTGELNNLAAWAAAYKAAGYDFIKTYTEGPERLDSLAAAARQVGIPMMGHISPKVGLDQGLAAGLQSIEHLTGYPNVHSFEKWVSPLDNATLAAATKRAGVWHCPTLSVLGGDTTHPGLPEEGKRAFAGRAERAGRLVKALHEAGVGLLLGVDAVQQDAMLINLERGSSIPGELALLVRAGLTPYQALETGTRNIAVFWGTLDSTGTVAVGKRADLVLLTGNPLQDIRHVAGPVGTMLAGRWLTRVELEARAAAPASRVP